MMSSKSCCSHVGKVLRNGENLLLLLTALGVVIGLALGVGLRQTDLSPRAVQLIGFPGELLMRGLQLLILPLIITSLISALVSSELKSGGRLALGLVAYYALTTTLASVTGIVLVTSIQPGYRSASLHSGSASDEAPPTASATDSFLSLLRNLIPENIFGATFQQSATVHTKVQLNGSSEWESSPGMVPGANILGVVVFCVGFGAVAASLGSEAELVAKLFSQLDKVSFVQ